MLFCNWFIFTDWSFSSLWKCDEMLPLSLQFHSSTKLLESCRMFWKFQVFFIIIILCSTPKISNTAKYQLIRS